MATYTPPVSPHIDFAFGTLHNPYTPPVSPHLELIFGEEDTNPLIGTAAQANFMLILTQ